MAEPATLTLEQELRRDIERLADAEAVAIERGKEERGYFSTAEWDNVKVLISLGRSILEQRLRALSLADLRVDIDKEGER